MKFEPFPKIENAYVFECILKAPCNKTSLEQIIKCGKELGFIYIDCSNTKETLLSVDTLVDKIVNNTKSIAVKTKVEDIFILLVFDKTIDNLLIVSFINIFPRWIKQTDYELDWGSHDIDLARYMRLLLRFTDSFLIQQIKTYTKPAQYE